VCQFIFEGVVSGPQNVFGVLSVEPPANTEEQKWGFLMLAKLM
jgi:hypothetical protein